MKHTLACLVSLTLLTVDPIWHLHTAQICLRMVSAPDTIDADAVDAIYKAFKAVLLVCNTHESCGFLVSRCHIFILRKEGDWTNRHAPFNRAPHRWWLTRCRQNWQAEFAVQSKHTFISIHCRAWSFTISTLQPGHVVSFKSWPLNRFDGSERARKKDFTRLKPLLPACSNVTWLLKCLRTLEHKPSPPSWKCQETYGLLNIVTSRVAILPWMWEL